MAAGIFVVAVLGLPGPVLAYFFLQGPWHVATTLWCLLAFIALTRTPTRWNFVAAIGLLAAGLLGDPMTLAIGSAPILVWGLLNLRGSTNDRSAWRPFFAVGASVIAALVVRVLAYTFGGFAMVERSDPISNSQMVWNLAHVGSILGALIGVNSLRLPSGTPQVSVLFHVARLFAAMLIATGVIAALVQLVRRASQRPIVGRSFRVDDLLVLAFFADLITFVVVSSGPGVNNARYLIPAVVFGSILGARIVGRAAASIRGTRTAIAAASTGLVMVAAFALGPFEVIHSSRPSRPAAGLTAFLEQKGLRDGLGDYWSSSIVTVESREKVVVRPVVADDGDSIVRDNRQSDASWYSGRKFQFLVYNSVGPGDGVDLASASATFGKPTHTYDVGTYRLLVWDHPVRVSAVLKPPGSLLRGFWEP